MPEFKKNNIEKNLNIPIENWYDDTKIYNELVP